MLGFFTRILCKLFCRNLECIVMFECKCTSIKALQILGRLHTTSCTQ